jgi:hypothetical protein
VGAFAVLIAGSLYFHWIVPLQNARHDTARRIVDLRHQLELARQSIDHVRNLEQETGHARENLNALIGDFPANSLFVGIPQIVNDHFHRFAIPVSLVRLNTVLDVVGLPGYTRTYWGVAFPLGNDARSVSGLLLAVAELEEQNPFVRVLDLSVRPDAEDPMLRTAAINIVAFVHK